MAVLLMGSLLFILLVCLFIEVLGLAGFRTAEAITRPVFSFQICKIQRIASFGLM